MSDNIELYIAVHNCDTFAWVSSANVINVGISFVMLIINQRLHLRLRFIQALRSTYKHQQKSDMTYE